jgi:hypothetical protein
LLGGALRLSLSIGRNLQSTRAIRKNIPVLKTQQHYAAPPTYFLFATHIFQ